VISGALPKRSRRTSSRSHCGAALSMSTRANRRDSCAIVIQIMAHTTRLEGKRRTARSVADEGRRCNGVLTPFFRAKVDFPDQDGEGKLGNIDLHHERSELI